VSVSDRPIFIGGMFKSGTSLLRAMIGQHPNIASGLETYWFDLPWPIPEPDERIYRLASFYGFAPADLHALARECADVPMFLTRLLDGYASRLGKRRWAEKTPGNVRHMGRILSVWSDARIIHVIRDPKDIFASLQEAKKWNSIEEFTERWCGVFDAVESFRRDHQAKDGRYIEMRYESLVADPVATTKELCSFLDEPWSEELASFSGKPDDYEKVLSVTGKASTTLSRLSQPLTAGRVGIWREMLSDAQINALRHAVADRGLETVFRDIEEFTAG
jgi:hypothetical protein